MINGISLICSPFMRRNTQNGLELEQKTTYYTGAFAIARNPRLWSSHPKLCQECCTFWGSINILSYTCQCYLFELSTISQDAQLFSSKRPARKNSHHKLQTMMLKITSKIFIKGKSKGLICYWKHKCFKYNSITCLQSMRGSGLSYFSWALKCW